MSAASSGFDLPYNVVPPTDEDLTGCKKGRILHYKDKMCGTAERLRSSWWISKVRNDGRIEVSPLNSRHVNGTLIVSRNDKTRHFNVRPRRI